MEHSLFEIRLLKGKLDVPRGTSSLVWNLGFFKLEFAR